MPVDSKDDLIRELAALTEGEQGILANTIVTTAFAADGSLGPIRGAKAKLTATINHTGYLPIKTFAVAADQADLLQEPGIAEYSKETASPRLLNSEHFTDLVGQLSAIKPGRIGVKPIDYSLVLGRTYKDFVGRRVLFERLQSILDSQSRDRGYVVLTAGPGFGKTAIALELIERYRGQSFGKAKLGAWHILRKTQADWVPVVTLAGQIEWRLRDRMGCPLGDDNRKVAITTQNAVETMHAALKEAAGKLKSGQRLLIVVDGIDEAFGANAPTGLDQRHLLQELFPAATELPMGVFILLTSRPGPHLRDWLHNLSRDEIIDMDRCDDELAQENQEDLTKFLMSRLMRVGNFTGEASETIGALAVRMVDASEGAFFAAEWFARTAGQDRTQFQVWLDGGTLPRGIDEVLLEDWRHKHRRLKECSLLPVLAAAIAVWHAAGTVVTRALIENLFEFAGAATRRGATPAPPEYVGRMDTGRINPEAVDDCLLQLHDWFDGGANQRGHVFTFRHSRIPELLFDVILPESTVVGVHQLLAWSCLRWKKLKGASRMAALANGPWHMAECGDLHAVLDLLGNLANPYLEAVFSELLHMAISVLARNFASASRLALRDENAFDPPLSDIEPPPWNQLRDIWRVLSVHGTAFLSPEFPLAPTLFNELAAAWNPGSQAHKSLVQAEKKYNGVWLKRLNPSPPDRKLIAVLRGHSSAVTHVAWSPNGQFLVSSSCDGTVRRWDGLTGQALGTLGSETVDYIRSIPVWSPDGLYVANRGGVWDGSTGEIGVEYDPKLVYSLVWAPDGRQLAGYSRTHDVLLIDRDSWRITDIVPSGHPEGIERLEWFPDGSGLIAISHRGMVQMWDVTIGMSMVKRFESRQHWGTFIGESRVVEGTVPGEQRIVYIDYANGIKFRDGRTGAPIVTPRFMQNGFINHLAWSPDGKRLAACTSKRKLMLWDVRTGETLTKPSQDLNGKGSFATWSQDGDMVATINKKAIYLWNGETGSPLGMPLTGHADDIEHLAWSPNGERLASASKDGTVRLWDVKSALLPQSTPLDLHSEPAGIHIGIGREDNAAGYRYFICHDGGPIDVWDEKNTDLFHRLTTMGRGVGCFAWTSDQESLAGGYDRAAWLWNSKTGEPIRRISRHGDRLTNLTWSPDGKQLASISENGEVHVWTGNRDKLLARRWDDVRDAANAHRLIAWSGDSTRLASVGRKGLVRIWDTTTYCALTGVRKSSDYSGRGKVTCLSWSPERSRLASGTSSGEVCLWEGNTGEVITVAFQRGNGVELLAWSPDGKILASASKRDLTRHLNQIEYEEEYGDSREFGAIALWDGETGKALGELARGDISYPRHLSWSPDGMHVACIVNEDTLCVWSVTTRSLEFSIQHVVITELAWHGDELTIAVKKDDQHVETRRYRLHRRMA